MQFDYNNKGQMISQTYPNQFGVEFIYDNLDYGNLIEIQDAQSQTLWLLQNVNAEGQITQYMQGQSEWLRSYNATSALPEQISNGVWNFDYEFDAATGNLNSRELNGLGPESFEYDHLDRLTDFSDINGTSRNTSYTSSGSILSQTDVGIYTNNPDNNGQTNEILPHSPGFTVPISGEDQIIVYTPFNSVASIYEDDYEAYFSYGVDQQRREMDVKKSNKLYLKRTYTHSGLFEKEFKSGQTFEFAYVYAPTGLLGFFHEEENSFGTGEFVYVATDYQGTIWATMDEMGIVQEEYAYDPWGNRRDPVSHNPIYYPGTAGNLSFTGLLYRGYTGHEHLEMFGLINMNGRLYDPLLGRMLSPDNYINGATNSQAYNRYAYVFNNPLKYTDPSGEIILPLLLFATDFGYELQKYISPAAVKLNLGLGSEGFHVGIETSVGLPKALSLSYRWHFGLTYYSSAYDGGVSNNVRTNGKEITYFGFFSLSSTQYQSKASDGTNTSQIVGRVMIGKPGLNIKYQNDWHPELLNNLAIGFDINDGGDRYRSAAFQLNKGFFKYGFNLFTGDPGLDDDDRIEIPGSGLHNGKDVYSSGNINKYRSGIAYVGFGPIRFGGNSEGIRHQIQNRFAHDFMQGGEAPHIQVLNRSSQPYWYFGSGFGSGLW